MQYIITVESDKAPQFFLEEIIPNVGKVVKIEVETLPKRVGVAWLMERYSLSRKTIIAHLEPFNKGGDGKFLYEPQEVMPILDNLNNLKMKTSRRRKN